MSDDNVLPGILSMEFHIRFFPGLLRDRLRPRKKERHVFVFDVFTKGVIGLIVCLLLAAWGVPLVLSHRLNFGWVEIILGIVGLAALVLSSVNSQQGSRSSYHNFLSGIFYFVFHRVSEAAFYTETRIIQPGPWSSRPRRDSSRVMCSGP